MLMSTLCAPTILMLACAAVSGEEELKLIQTIKDEAGINDHVGPVTIQGDYVYAAVHYKGVIKVFKRDAATAKLTYTVDVPMQQNDMSVDGFVWASGRLYCFGGAGHETGDQDARGLHWFDVDAASGKLTEKGKLDLPLINGLVASADGKQLYVMFGGQRKIMRLRIGADGAPAKIDEFVVEQASGGIGEMTLSQDGKNLYVHSGALHALTVAADGTLAYQGHYPFEEKLTEGIQWPTGKWGWGWGNGSQPSPDGKFYYGNFCNYGGGDFRTAVFLRNPATGAIEFKGRMEDKTGPRMTRVSYAFESNGALGYFSSGPECSGNVVGWFSRDPASGVLTFGGTVDSTNGKGPNNILFDSEHGVIYVGTWGSCELMVLQTRTGPNKSPTSVKASESGKSPKVAAPNRNSLPAKR